MDPVAGLNSYYVLPKDLRNYLEYYGITSLSHAHNLGTRSFSRSYWLSVVDLDLRGCWKEIWTNYVNGLSHGCIRLGEGMDSLL